MKYLLLFLVLSACGKHQQPIGQDLRDSDGDSIRNNIDRDKFMANIVTIDEIHATLEFQTGQNILKTHSYKLSNETDLESQSKDLLVKNALSLNDHIFFSEFSKMSFKSSSQQLANLDSRLRITLHFSKTKNQPKSIFLVTPKSKIRLSEWAEKVEFSLTQDDLNSLIAGKYFLWLSHTDNSSSLEEDIKNKSYRIFYNKGSQTQVFYISKELSIPQILNSLGISKYKNIEEENLLTTTIKPEVSEWWVRILNTNDIVIVHANSRELSDHYFTTLEHRTEVVSRLNGFSSADFSLNKNINARILLKIRAIRKAANFEESIVDNRRRVGGIDNTDKWGCVTHVRSRTPEFSTDFTNEDFQRAFLLNGNYSQQQTEPLEIRYLEDEMGPFWEIEILNTDFFVLSLSNISKALYKPTGAFKSEKCIGDSKNRVYNNNLQTYERSLVLNIEAFVEIIPE